MVKFLIVYPLKIANALLIAMVFKWLGEILFFFFIEKLAKSKKSISRKRNSEVKGHERIFMQSASKFANFDDNIFGKIN